MKLTQQFPALFFSFSSSLFLLRMSSSNSSTKRDFERVDYDIEKTLYPDPPNDSFNELNASHQIEKSMMMHRVPTAEPLEEIPSMQKDSTSIESPGEDDDGDHEKKQISKFSLFYNRHKMWFQ
jgi:hypothetical protein